jgi:hypothetical protein
LSFTATRVSLAFGGESLPHKLVYRRAEIERLRDAGAIVDRARRAAVAIVQHARETARAVEAQAAAARRERERDAQVALIARARALEEAYRLAQATFIAQVEATLDGVLAAALARIGAALPAQQRLQIVCEQLAREAGPAALACLHLSAADEALRRDAGLHLPWATQIDDTLAPGHCRLIGEQGEWTLDFDTFMAALTAAAGGGSRAEAGD